MGSRFYFGGSDDSGSDFEGNESSLPFPKPLARSAFLGPDFDPATFLAGFSDRFQTLEDLHTELRALSQSLNKELLDLVNDNYQDFLSLGSTLSTGEEKVEEVRVGLLGFQRDLSSIKGKVDARRNEVAQLLKEKRGLKQDIRDGRALLEIAERLDYLEERLLIMPRAKGGPGGVQKEVDLDDGYESEDLTDDSQEDQSDNDSESKNKHRRLQRLVERCTVIRVLLDRHPQTAAFIGDQDERLREVQATLRLDIEAALKQEADLGADSSTIRNLVQMRLGLEARI